MSLKTSLPAVIFVFALSALPNLSQAQDTVSIQPQTAPSGIEYVSGGIGEKQQETMKAMRKDYDLRLTFARPKTGGYLADVNVMIENAKKETVLDTVSPGPLLFAKLPNGRYKVTAEFEGQRQTKNANIRGGRPVGLIYYFAKK